MTIAEQLRAFNEQRQAQYGRAPLPDERLPIPYTGKGGDIDPMPSDTVDDEQF